jgi:hypothetical protein
MTQSSSLFLFRLFLFQAILAMLLSFPLVSHAQGLGEQRISVQKHLRANESLQLGQLIPILPQGIQIESISILCKSPRQSATLSLLQFNSLLGSALTPVSQIPSLVEIFLPTLLSQAQGLELSTTDMVIIDELIIRTASVGVTGGMQGGGHGGGYGQGGVQGGGHGGGYGQGGVQGGGHGGGHGGGYGQQPGQLRIETITLRQNVMGQALIDITHALQIRSRDQRERSLESLDLEISSNGPARIELLINRRSVGLIQHVQYRDRMISFQLPRMQNVIGRDIRSIELQISGNVFLEDAIVRTRESQIMMPRVITIQVNRSMRAREQVSLQQLIGHLPQGAHRRVIGLSIRGVSMRRGDIGVIDVRTGPVGRATFDEFTRDQQIRLYQALPIQDIGLRVVGQVTIQSITLELE